MTPSEITVQLTAIVITKNEEKNISRCIRSLQIVADEIIVVDSGSTDKTLEILSNFPAVTVLPAEWLGFVENKKIAIEKAQFDWILWVDADEEVPLALAEEWKKQASQGLSQEIGGITVPRKTFFLGHWVKHSGWYPGRVIRFFHKKRAHLSESILHEGVTLLPGYRSVDFMPDLLHHSYTSLYQYFDKMNKYGIYGAREAIRKNKKFFFFQIILQPIWTFFRFFVLKKGFLDGKIGVIVCVGASFSNFIKYTNYFFLKKYGYTELAIDPVI